MNGAEIGSTVTPSARRTVLHVHVPNVVRFVVTKAQADANVNRVSQAQLAMFAWRITTATMPAVMKVVSRAPVASAASVQHAISIRVNANVNQAWVEGKGEKQYPGRRR